METVLSNFKAILKYRAASFHGGKKGAKEQPYPFAFVHRPMLRSLHEKNTNIKRCVSTGRFTVKPLGKEKAKKFSQVEGMSLSKQSSRTFSRLEQSGFKGDALRAAILGAFVSKAG